MTEDEDLAGAARDSLRERMTELLAEARAAGVLGDLRPVILEALEEDPRAAGSESSATGVPARFGMVGDSPAMHMVFELIEKVARSDVAVLILGETGTGKELVASALHRHGPRKDHLFLAENCAAVPADLLESELFGHSKGSFTGAIANRVGHFVAADGGTVFLDEIGDMPLAMQAKLLRVLQDGEVRPVGSNATKRVDVRVIAATNKDLVAMCAAGTFREDLYFRLNVVTIQLPPLRERPGDVSHLIRFFLDRIGEEMGPRIAGGVTFEDDALEALARWRWPGNVRELENEIRRSVALCSGPIGLEDLSPQIAGNA